SARRAVEAADNVVLAYDMNMGDFSAVDSGHADGDLQEMASQKLQAPKNTTSPSRGHKRGRSIDDSSDQLSKTPRLSIDRQGTRHRSSSPRLGRSTRELEVKSVPSLAMSVIGPLSPGFG